jgi:hypothetical protein
MQYPTGMPKPSLVAANYICKYTAASTTGLWLGYNGLRYGPDQAIAKSPQKPWKMAGLEINARRKKFHFKSP